MQVLLLLCLCLLGGGEERPSARWRRELLGSRLRIGRTGGLSRRGAVLERPLCRDPGCPSIDCTSIIGGVVSRSVHQFTFNLTLLSCAAANFQSVFYGVSAKSLKYRDTARIHAPQPDWKIAYFCNCVKRFDARTYVSLPPEMKLYRLGSTAFSWIRLQNFCHYELKTHCRDGHDSPRVNVYEVGFSCQLCNIYLHDVITFRFWRGISAFRMNHPRPQCRTGRVFPDVVAPNPVHVALSQCDSLLSRQSGWVLRASEIVAWSAACR